MIALISGGSKSGKSGYAQDLAVRLANGGPLYYIATMIPTDGEDRRRIALHIEDRAGMGFTTIECGREILSVLARADSCGTFLLDSTTALLSNEMFQGMEIDHDAGPRVAGQLCRLAESVGNLIVVSDRIYEDAQQYDAITEDYRRSLAWIDRRLAAMADVVVELVGGMVYVHKGEEVL